MAAGAVVEDLEVVEERCAEFDPGLPLLAVSRCASNEADRGYSSTALTYGRVLGGLAVPRGLTTGCPDSDADGPRSGLVRGLLVLQAVRIADLDELPADPPQPSAVLGQLVGARVDVVRHLVGERHTLPPCPDSFDQALSSRSQRRTG